MIKHARPLLVSMTLGAAAVALAGCGGFTPLYGAPGVSPKLAAIDVSRPDGRTGFLLGQYLDDALAKNRGEAPVYRLVLKTNEVRIPRGIRIDNVASRYEVDLNTSYTLVEIATHRTVTTGLVKVNVTYDSADQPYAGLSAEQNGQERVAEQTADRIRIELASFFASPRPLVAGAAQDTTNIATYSERLQPSQVQSPRARALGNPTAQSQNLNTLGTPLQETTAPDNPAPPQFNAPSDPAVNPPVDTPTTATPPDPAAIKTIPEQ